MSIQEAYDKMSNQIKVLSTVNDGLVSDVRDLQQRTHSLNKKIEEIKNERIFEQI